MKPRMNPIMTSTAAATKGRFFPTRTATDPKNVALIDGRNVLSKLAALQRQKQAEESKAAADEAAKKKRLIIGGSIAGALLLVGGVVIYSKSKN